MRAKCRFCGNVRKEGVVWYDDDYCSGKCRKNDGGETRPAEQPVADFSASLEDYLLDYPKGLGEKDARGQRIRGRLPKRYRRRFEPDRLNWGAPLDNRGLKQCGFRANRIPLPGDFDYVEGAENG
tara:strand:+ start:1381 stop:1755 length:375 start_codon:yes stop_codon:yes gene_type:complete